MAKTDLEANRCRRQIEALLYSLPRCRQPKTGKTPVDRPYCEPCRQCKSIDRKLDSQHFALSACHLNHSQPRACRCRSKQQSCSAVAPVHRLRFVRQAAEQLPSPWNPNPIGSQSYPDECLDSTGQTTLPLCFAIREFHGLNHRIQRLPNDKRRQANSQQTAKSLHFRSDDRQ